MSAKEIEEINQCIDLLFEKVTDIQDSIEEINDTLHTLNFERLEALMNEIEKRADLIEKNLAEANEKFFDSVTRNTTKLGTMINEYKGFIAIERAKTAKFNASIREAVEKLSEE